MESLIGPTLAGTWGKIRLASRMTGATVTIDVLRPSRLSMTQPPSPAPRSPAAIVFDLDGVLIDSEAVWDSARRTVVAQAGGHWQPDATRAMMGMSSSEWSRYLHEQLAVPLAPEEINQLVVAHVLDRYQHDLPLLPAPCPPSTSSPTRGRSALPLRPTDQ